MKGRHIRRLFACWLLALPGSVLLISCNRPPYSLAGRDVVAERRLIDPAPPVALPVENQLGTAEPDLSDQALIAYGAELYAVYCAACHQANGEGNLNRFPALNNNALVVAQQPQPLITTVLYGRGVMPGFADLLSDQEIAAILSHIRTTWSNDASVISAMQVSEVQAATTPTPDIIGSVTDEGF